MDIEKNTIIAGAAAAVGVVGLAMAIFTQTNVNATSRTLNFNTKVAVDTTPVSQTSTADASETEESGELTTGDEEVTASDTTGITGGFNVVDRDGVLKVTDSIVKVPAPEGSSDIDDIYIYLEGENSIRYDSKSNYLIVNDDTIVRTISADDVSYDNSICKFVNEDDKEVLIGEKVVTDNAAIAALRIMTESEDASGSTTDADMVNQILQGAAGEATITSAKLFGYSVNPEWVENVVMTGKGVEFMKGDSSIYVTPYIGSFAEGTTNSLSVGDLALTYSDNIKDSNTGYIPYIFSFKEQQDGSVGGNIKAKLLATSNLNVKDFFVQ